MLYLIIDDRQYKSLDFKDVIYKSYILHNLTIISSLLDADYCPQNTIDTHILSIRPVIFGLKIYNQRSIFVTDAHDTVNLWIFSKLCSTKKPLKQNSME